MGKRCFFVLEEQFPLSSCKNFIVTKGRAAECMMRECTPSSLWCQELLVNIYPLSLTWHILRSRQRGPNQARARQFT